MLEKVKQLGLEKFAGDEAKAQEFVKGFVKEVLEKSADDKFRAKTLFESAKEGVGASLGRGLGGLAVGTILGGIGSAYQMANNSRLHTEFLSALEKAVTRNQVLRSANKDRVKEYAETIFKFAPHVACDANLLSQILANAIHGEGIDPMTIRTLGDLEARYRDNSSFSLNANVK